MTGTFCTTQFDKIVVKNIISSLKFINENTEFDNKLAKIHWNVIFHAQL